MTGSNRRATNRKRWPKGTWMTLKDPETLAAWMERKGFSGNRLARYAGCSRQFIHQLLHGERTSMTPRLAMNIAEALDVPLDALFVPSVSTSNHQKGRDRLS